jgi:protein-S-isoprenylcysteine O-methyltransferase Ste14
MTDTSKPGLLTRAHRSPNSSILGIVVFSTLRLIDPIVQHAIITRRIDLASFLPRLFGGTIASAPFATSLSDVLDLPPYNQLILLLSLGGALKHTFWVTTISQMEFPAGIAAGIALFNTVFNCINTVFSLWSVTSPYENNLLDSPSIVIGSVISVLGILIEVISEIQRAQFKKDPANAGKPYSGGLFGWARHINYGGYLLWRTGFALAAGGPVWGLFSLAFFGQNFVFASIPELDAYCQKRVGHLLVLANFSTEMNGPRTRKRCHTS